MAAAVFAAAKPVPRVAELARISALAVDVEAERERPWSLIWLARPGPEVAPVAFLLAFLSREELQPLRIFGMQLPGTFTHLAFHVSLGATGYSLYRRALRRELLP